MGFGVGQLLAETNAMGREHGSLGKQFSSRIEREKMALLPPPPLSDYGDPGT